MRIAQVAPLYEAVPPRLYGGTERVVHHLTEELVRRGHDVTLFASGDSTTSACHVATRDVAIRLDEGPTWDVPAVFEQMETVRDMADEFDVIHFHPEVWPAPFFRDIAGKTVTTLHGRLDVPDLVPFFRRYPHFPLVSISDSQRRPFPHLNWQATIHHGYPPDLYRFTAEPEGGYLAFLGRIAPEKGPDRAIEIAKRADMPLKIAAKVDPADRAYFKQHIAPLLEDENVDFIGEIDDDQKSDFLGQAAALVVPIEWPEPFGLVMIEAQACGTPVIAFNWGSVPEVVEDGVTGRVVSGVDEAVEAVQDVETLDRRRIRAEFESRFTLDAMATNYEAVYERLADRFQSRRRVAGSVVALGGNKALGERRPASPQVAAARDES